MKTKSYKLIIIDARRWFDRINGNTYHAVTVTVQHARRPDVVLHSGTHYGYGEQYLQTAHSLLKDEGYFPAGLPELKSGADPDYIVFLDAMRNSRPVFHVTVTDVRRKKDL